MNGEAATWTKVVLPARPSRPGAPSRKRPARRIGDAKLVADGKDDKVEGKIQNAIGRLKNALKK